MDQILNRALNQYATKNEKLIISLFYCENKELTIEEISQILKISTEEVRRNWVRVSLKIHAWLLFKSKD